MPKYLFSKINPSGTRAVVLDPIAGQTLASVRKTQGEWEAVCSQTGGLLLPRIAENRIEIDRYKQKREIPVTLGEVIRDLRGALCA